MLCDAAVQGRRLWVGIAVWQAPQVCSAAKNPFYLGADISSLAQVESRGGVYPDNGKSADALAIFMKNGWTCFRLRIWVDPRNAGNGLEYTTKLAERIKSAGASFMLDFHYSDTWADPRKQFKPAAGATPDFVQIGNEITGGTLWPDAQVKVPLSAVKVFAGDVRVIAPPEPYDDDRQWSRLIRILKAGIRGVRSETTAADHVRIVIHIDCGGDWPVTKWYFDHLTKSHVTYDVIGQSFYPNYHGTMQNLRDA
jgi:arabinogalactan endo-1,4-beta-galactosidase